MKIELSLIGRYKTFATIKRVEPHTDTSLLIQQATDFAESQNITDPIEKITYNITKEEDSVNIKNSINLEEEVNQALNEHMPITFKVYFSDSEEMENVRLMPRVCGINIEKAHKIMLW